FCCSAAQLAVEVDGEGHTMGDNPEYDARRDAWLARRGIEVLRIPAIDVINECDGVLSGIEEAVRRRAPSGPSGHLVCRAGASLTVSSGTSA
ncbi:MAG: endonuclease domain-containing protein, partial [Caulobacteraceae bacterium]